MKRNPHPDPDQRKRFIEAARELGCDESPDAFEAAVKKIAQAPPLEKKPNDALVARREPKDPK